MALYTLSYDEADALADFARSHGITYPLLSDPDSEVIEAFGILNTLIDPDDHPWYGIPYPGVYLVDADGVIADKFFESSFMLRPSAEQLLRAALGEQLELPPVERVDGEVAVDVAFDGEMWWPGVVHDLVVRFAVPSGQHLYGEPVPDGMVATTVEVDDQVSLVVQPARLPPTSPHTLGTGETLQIFDGDVTVRVPMTHLGRALVPADDGRTVVRLTGTVRWQSCDDEACHLPRNESFSIEVPAAKHDSPASELEHPEGMDVRVRLGEMVSRRTDRPLGDIMREATAD